MSVPAFFGNLAPTNPETELAAAVMFAGLLRQAKIDSTPIGQILGVFKDYSSAELNEIVIEILNNNRVPTSLLGFRTQDIKPNQLRNIAA